MTDVAEVIEGAEVPTEQPAVDETPELSQEEQELLSSQEAEEAEAQQAAQEAEDAERKSAEEKPWFKKRFDKLTKQREDATRRADRLERMLEQQLSQQPKQEEAKPVVQPVQATRPKPTFEGCEFDQEKYTDELTDWKIEQVEAQRIAATTQKTEAQKQAEYASNFEKKRVDTTKAGVEKFPDFEEVVYSLPPEVMHQQLAEAIFATSEPSDVVYYLGKNPDEAEKIARLAPIPMAMELARLEVKAIVPVPEKKPTAAPKPVTPVNTNNASADLEPDPKKDPDGWIRWERERCRKAGKRY